VEGNFERSRCWPLQRTLNTLLAAGQYRAGEIHGRRGDLHHSTNSFLDPADGDQLRVKDGNLIIASSRETVAEAVRLHKAGESLGESKAFLAALSPGHTLELRHCSTRSHRDDNDAIAADCA